MLLVEGLDDPYLLDLQGFELFGDCPLVLGTFEALDVVGIVIVFNYGSHHVVSDRQAVLSSLLDLLRAQLFRLHVGLGSRGGLEHLLLLGCLPFFSPFDFFMFDLFTSGLHRFELVRQNKDIEIGEATPNLILSDCLNFGVLVEGGEFIFEFSELATPREIDCVLLMFEIVGHSPDALLEQIVELVVLACPVVLLGIV